MHMLQASLVLALTPICAGKVLRSTVSDTAAAVRRQDHGKGEHILLVRDKADKVVICGHESVHWH